jgi:hypothetical protein
MLFAYQATQITRPQRCWLGSGGKSPLSPSFLRPLMRASFCVPINRLARFFEPFAAGHHLLYIESVPLAQACLQADILRGHEPAQADFKNYAVSFLQLIQTWVQTGVESGYFSQKPRPTRVLPKFFPWHAYRGHPSQDWWLFYSSAFAMRIFRQTQPNPHPLN